MEAIVAIIYRALRATIGQRRAYAVVYAVLYRLARGATRRVYGNAPGTAVEEKVRHVYGHVGSEQEALIKHSGDLLVIHVPDCRFAYRFRQWGCEELTKAFCDADRDYWAEQGLLAYKSTRFDETGRCIIELRNEL